MMTSPLIQPETSMLLHIDLQERLLPAIDGAAEVLANAVWLTQIARRLGVPVGATVQYPQGLGQFAPALGGLLAPGETVEKLNFSAVREGCLATLAGFDRAQLVLTGSEAHVCVLQTALDLHAAGKQVFVVADAIGSRRAADRQLAIERMRAAGLTIVSREMVAFEWLQRAGSEVFREISRNYLR
jgi:nicotinamidase-related amidase